MPYRLLGFWLLAGFCCAGCSKSEEAPSAEATSPFEGRWLLTITQDIQDNQRGDYQDVTALLLEIKKSDGDYEAEILGRRALPRAKVKSFEVNEDRIHLVLLHDDYTFDFEGTYDGKRVRGSMHQGGFLIEPAALVKTTIVDISEAQTFSPPLNLLEHKKLLLEASQENAENISLFANYEAFRKFYDAHPESPLSIIMYHALVNVLPDKAKSDEEVREFAKAYLKLAGVWGDRMKTLARFNLGRCLARQAEFASLGLKYLDEAEAKWEGEEDFVQKEIDYFRVMARRSQTQQDAAEAFSEVKAGRAAGMERLRKLSEQYPFDPVVMYHRAEAARITDQSEEALKLYAQLAVWPRLQSALQSARVWQSGERKLPEGRLLELWAKKHGSEAGLDDYKKAIYQQALDLIARQTGAPKSVPAGNRVSVMELFTGTNCPPCLGADLATSALEKIHPPSNLVVLRYHVHTNGLDPLTNPRNLDRFGTLLGPNSQDYQTPSVFINGKPAASSVGGFLDNATEIAKNLGAEVLPFLDEKTPLSFKLSAYEHEGEISISSKLTGVPEAQRDKLRVLLLLAERELEFPAPNGIRQHDMLVRWLFQDGTSFALPSSGEFQFAAKLSVKDIRNLIESSTHDYARQMKEEVSSIPLDLKGLSFVALVHDGETQEILQAAVVPVEVFDTKPMLPSLPMPNLPTTGPMLIGPHIDVPPAKAEKPQK